MMTELAFRHANNGHLGVHLPTTESTMMAELAFQHSNNGTSQCPLTGYRKSNDHGVSLPT